MYRTPKTDQEAEKLHVHSKNIHQGNKLAVIVSRKILATILKILKKRY